MRIAVLTSSRADYGIYLPLLKVLQEDPFFDLRLLVFGTHVSSFHGHTIDAIIKDGFTIDHIIEHMIAADTEAAIATSMAVAFSKFSMIWEQEQQHYDLVFCLGDRYEMFAAVSAATPFRIKFAHIHGGETTLGAIDNEFRHCITVLSSLHFVATETYADRVAAIKGNADNICVTGSLSLENLKNVQLLPLHELNARVGVDLSEPSLLVTYHPKTAGSNENLFFAEQLVKALYTFKGYQVIITMPNADTMGNTMRKVYETFANETSNVVLVKNLGTQGYFSCMKHCKLIVGNSSSGIIEAASFNKYVINIGDRQKGRAVSDNIINCRPDARSITEACETALNKGEYRGKNIYYKKNAVQKIISLLKKC